MPFPFRNLVGALVAATICVTAGAAALAGQEVAGNTQSASTLPAAGSSAATASAGATATAKPDASSDPKPVTRRNTFTINLGNAAIEGTLPFDIPFTLVGMADSTLERVDMWFARRTVIPQGTCTALIDSIADTYDIIAQDDDNESKLMTRIYPNRALVREGPAHAPDGKHRWRLTSTDDRSFRRALQDAGIRLKVFGEPAREGPVTHVAWTGFGARVQQFALSMPPIEPNTEYSYCLRTIRRPSGAQIAAFRVRAVAKLVPLVRQLLDIYKSGSFDSVALQRVRDTLRTVLPLSAGVTATPGSIFSVGPIKATGLDAALRPISQLGAVRATRGGVFDEERTQLSFDLDTLSRRNAALRILMRQASHLLPDSERPRLLRGYQVAVSILATTIRAPGKEPFAPDTLLGQHAGAFLVRGQYSLETINDTLGPIDLDTTWDPAELAPFQSNIQRSLDGLLGLRELTSIVINGPSGETLSARDRLELTRLLAITDQLILDFRQAAITYGNVASSLASLGPALTRLVAVIDTTGIQTLELAATSEDSFKARANWYVSPDLGFIYAWRLDGVVPYAGVNFYFQPVNKEKPLKLSCWQKCWGDRISVTVGITFASVAKDSVQTDLFGSSNVVAGLGVRMTDFIRVTAGAVVFRSYDHTHQTVMNTAPFVGASIDIDVKQVLGQVASVFK